MGDSGRLIELISTSFSLKSDIFGRRRSFLKPLQIFFFFKMPSNSTSPHAGGGHNGTSSTKNATAIAAQKAQMASRHAAKMWNQNSVKIFAGAMAGVIILFTIFHWSRFLYSRYAPRGMRKSGLMRAQVSVARFVKLL